MTVGGQAIDAMPERNAQGAEAAHWPIFVINLPDAVARRESILRQCAELGLSVTVVEAVDGRRGLPAGCEAEVDRAAAQARVGRALSDAELACALSHRSVYQRIVDENLPGAVILEDDAILTPLFAPFIRQQGYRAAPFIQMDHLDARVWYGRRWNWSAEVMLIPLAENASLATGYALSQDMARHLLARATPVAGLADFSFDMAAQGAVVTWPKLVDHPPFETSDSAIEAGRKALAASRSLPRDRATRFFRAAYWRRWWFKRRTRKIS